LNKIDKPSNTEMDAHSLPFIPESNNPFERVPDIFMFCNIIMEVMMTFLKKLKDSYWEIYKKNNPPIRNLDKLDLSIGLNDGGSEFYIFTDEHSIDSSSNTQKLLREKVVNYLKYINSTDFKNNFKKSTKDNTNIIIVFKIMPDGLLLEFIRNMIPWVKDNNAVLKIEVNKNQLDKF